MLWAKCYYEKAILLILLKAEKLSFYFQSLDPQTWEWQPPLERKVFLNVSLLEIRRGNVTLNNQASILIGK